MPATLPNTTTTDDYKDTHLGGVDNIYAKGQLLIANRPVSLRIHTAFETGAPRVSEFPYITPTLLPLVSGAPTPQSPKPERICLVEVKSALVGSPAQVSGWLIEPSLAGPDLGAEFSASVASSGAVTPGQGSVQIQKDGALVGTEPIIDFLTTGALLGSVADDPANTRVTVGLPRVLTGRFTGAGAVVSGTGFTVAHVGAGQNTVTITNPFSAAPLVVATVSDNSGTVFGILVANEATNGFQINTYVSNTGVLTNSQAVNFWAIGYA